MGDVRLKKSFSDIMRREGELDQTQGSNEAMFSAPSAGEAASAAGAPAGAGETGLEPVAAPEAPEAPAVPAPEAPQATPPEEPSGELTEGPEQNQDRTSLMGTNLERDAMREMPSPDDTMVSESSEESVMGSVEEPGMGQHVRMLAKQAKEEEQVSASPMTLVGEQSDTLSEELEGLDQFEGLGEVDEGDIEIVATDLDKLKDEVKKVDEGDIELIAKSLDEFKVEVTGDKEILAEELESLGVMVRENREKINDLEFIMESMDTMGAKKMKDKIKTKRKPKRRKGSNRRKKTRGKKKTRRRRKSKGKKKSKGKTKRR